MTTTSLPPMPNQAPATAQAPAASTATGVIHAPPAANPVAPAPRKRGKNKPKAAGTTRKTIVGKSRTVAVPKALDAAKLAKTPIVSLRSMVRSRKLATGTQIVRLTKEQAINLLLVGSTVAKDNPLKADTDMAAAMNDRHSIHVRGNPEQILKVKQFILETFGNGQQHTEINL